ncbi:MAG: aspartate carbamoyltransferase catalytic subunit [Planctomycetota bacterium]
MTWTRKHLLGLEGLTREEIISVLDEARALKPVAVGKKPPLGDLAGMTVVNLFFETSTRTAHSFTAAARRVGAQSVNFSASGSAVSKGESLGDTARNLEAIGADVFVIRHSAAGAPRVLAERTRASVINAGDGQHEHPTQGLLDIFTIREELGRVEGLTVGIVGDIRHSRVARSNLWGLKALGARVILIGPPTLLPRELAACGAELTEDLDAVLPELDVVNVLRIQLERMKQNFLPSLREYSRVWGLNAERMADTKPGLLVMHPGPTNRGVEIAPDVADGPRSVILNQVTNGVAVRMAVLRLVTGGGGSD